VITDLHCHYPMHLRDLEVWIRDEYPADAEGILRHNATRVLRRVFAARS
jgi:hypothetical protein